MNQQPPRWKVRKTKYRIRFHAVTCSLNCSKCLQLSFKDFYFFEERKEQSRRVRWNELVASLSSSSISSSIFQVVLLID